MDEKERFIRKKKEMQSVAEKQKSEIPDKTEDAMDAIDLLIAEAKKHGMTVLDYVKHTYQTWDKNVQLEVLSGLYDSFLDAVQEEMSKEPYGKGKFRADSNFEEFLSFTSKECKSRLEELDWLKKQQKPSFAGLVKFLPNMKNVPVGVGEPLSQENFEFFELLYRKTLELVDEILQNPEKLVQMMNEIEERAKLNVQVDQDLAGLLEGKTVEVPDFPKPHA